MKKVPALCRPQIRGNGQVLAPVPVLMGIVLSLMPALVGSMLTLCQHLCISAIFHSSGYATIWSGLFWGRKKRQGNRYRYSRRNNIRPLGQAPRQGPRIFGLTKMLGGYHYRQSRNDNLSPPHSHQPKGKPET